MSSNLSRTYFVIFCGLCVTVLKEVNLVVDEPYMDEPFHIPQAQAYCRGEYDKWDPKITTPPGLYVMSLLFKKLFLFKCTLPMLRLTTTLSLLALPIVLTRLMCFHQRRRPPPLLAPSADAIVLSTFPVAWFFGFLYYTEVPSLVFVVLTVVAATQGKHWYASLLGILSCTFRQTNIVWVLYAFVSSQLMYLRFRRVGPGETESPAKFHDPPALSANFGDFVKSALSSPRIILELLPTFVPYALVLLLFGSFVAWNGGIVLGDKSNHIPSIHIPQMYYFVGFATLFGWPALVSGKAGVFELAREVRGRMFGGARRSFMTVVICSLMMVTVHFFTIHHPFLLSDNRHYTFYIWRRVYMLHPAIPYLLTPGYLACAWAWFLRVGRDQTLLQTLILPVLMVPTLLPTPLLEPRYFLIPYVLLRAQVVDMPTWALVTEGAWYGVINVITMGVFLYKERAGVGRFMW